MVNRKNEPFKPPFDLEKLAGLYPSFVKLNFFGDPEMQLLRDAVSIYDSNFFVSSYVLTCLLESVELGAVDVTEDHVMMVC